MSNNTGKSDYITINPHYDERYKRLFYPDRYRRK